MRHPNHERAPLFLTQFLHHFASCNYRIDIRDAFKVCRCDQSNRTDTEPKQSHANSADSFYNVTFDAAFEHSAFDVVVRGDDVKICKLQSSGERFDAVVEFVIAERTNVV